MIQILALLVPLTVGGYFAARVVWANHHLHEAEEALQRYEFLEAQEHLRQCLRVRGHDPKVLLLAARTARQAGLLDEAGRLLDDCAALQGTTLEMALERVLLTLRRGDLTQSDESRLWQVIEQRPAESIGILEVLVPYYLHHYHYVSAIRGLDLWLAEQPRSVAALLYRGQVYHAMGHPDRALEDYRRAVKAEPRSVTARLQLANYLVMLMKMPEATGHFEQLLESQPDNPAVLLGLARCRLHQGNLKEAQSLLERILTIQPDQVAALCEQGRIALAERRLGDAENWLQRAYKVDPFERDVLDLLAHCYQQLGKKDKAQEYQSAFEKVGKDLDRRIELTKESLLAPHNPNVRYEAGVICLRNGQAEEGLRWLSGALQIDPQHRPTHQALADYYEKAGEPELAARHRQEAAGHEEKRAGPGASRDK
jgi:Tfp pilus assembly protein PilF